MLDWLAQAPVLLVTALVLFVPGLLALWAVGLRGLALAAAAPLFGVAATGIAAMTLAFIGVPWSVGAWRAAVAVLVGAAALVGLILGRGRSEPPARRHRLLAVALAIGACFAIWRLAAYIVDPAGISQTNDAVFHMNAVQFILDTANASSLHVNGVIGGTSFYPAAWHALVSIVVSITGSSIPIAANMLTLVIGAFIWPLGITWLTRVVTRSDTAAASAAVLACSLHTFPLLMFQWGVLFPNALSTAMLPAGVALVLSPLAWRAGRRSWSGVARGVLLALVACCALLLAQPATLLPWLALILVRATAWLLSDSWAGMRVRRWGAVVALWALLAVVWILISRTTSGSHWPPFRGKLEVFLDVLLNGQLRIPFAFAISALMLCGLVLAWRDIRIRWFVFGWAGVSGLYVLAAAIGAPLVRVNLLGAWYADPYRIAALAPVVVVPLAALGLQGIITVVHRRLRRGDAEPRVPDRTAAALTLAAASAIMIVLTLLRPVAMPAVVEGSFDRESRYIAADDSYLSPDERTLLESLPDVVPSGTRVLANPSTGAGFGYMLSGVDVFPRTWSPPTTAAWEVLADGLRDAASDPAVCAALQQYGDPAYVLDFGLGDDTPGRYEMPGMTGFADRPGFEKISEVGDVSLWRITACAR